MKIFIGFVFSLILLWNLHYLSYSLLKKRILHRQRWDLNVCCGKTDGKGINADIVQHANIPRLVIVDVYHLPFKNAQFRNVLSSHTIEHVADPRRFFEELKRVGEDVTLVIPPLWDVSVVLNIFEHRWIFLSFSKVHHNLPRYIRLPFARLLQNFIGQQVRA